MSGKRSHGEGSVWKRKNGTWRGQIMDGYTDDGKKRIVSFSGETKAEVLDQIREYQNQRDADVHIDKKITLQNWGRNVVLGLPVSGAGVDLQRIQVHAQFD